MLPVVVHTGLNNMTSYELANEAHRRADPLSVELSNRFLDSQLQNEELASRIKDLIWEKDNLEMSLGIDELRRKLEEATLVNERLTNERKRIHDNFFRLKAAYQKTIADFKKRLADAPATW